MKKILKAFSSEITQKTQAILQRKKEEWEIEARKEQYQLNTKNYFNLTKQSEEQAKSIETLTFRIQELESRIQKLEKRAIHWKSYAIGAVVLMIILAILMTFFFLHF